MLAIVPDPVPLAACRGMPHMTVARKPLRISRHRLRRQLQPRVAVLVHLATVTSYALEGPDPESAITDLRSLRALCDEALMSVLPPGR